jgi:hypothetical protein
MSRLHRMMTVLWFRHSQAIPNVASFISQQGNVKQPDVSETSSSQTPPEEIQPDTFPAGLPATGYLQAEGVKPRYLLGFARTHYAMWLD